MKSLFRCLATIVLISGLVKTAWCGTYSYNIVDLSALIGPGSNTAVDINNNGQIIGQGASGTAYLYSNGTVTNLGTKNVHAINNSGQIAADLSSQGFIYSGGTWTNLGSDIKSANGINDSGKVVGYGNFVVDELDHKADRAYIYDNGSVTMLGSLIPTDPQAKSYAYSINNDGQVAGKADFPTRGFFQNAFFYSSGMMNNLGTFGGLNSSANVINNSGQIIGQADTATEGEHTFLYNGLLPPTDLSTIIFNSCRASYSYDINNLGQIVGNAVGLTSGSTCFIYDGAAMADLNTLIDPSLFYNIKTAQGINDLGQIVGTGKLTGYANNRALLLTPWLIWDGGGTDNNWSTANNWNYNTLPVDGTMLIFQGAVRPTNIRDGSLTNLGLITFSNGGFNISGNALTLNAGINNTGDNTWAINTTLAFAQTFTSSSGTLTISGTVNNNGKLLTIAGSGNHLISGVISGIGGLTKSGAGILTLSANNTYSGDTTINNGVLELAATGQIDTDSTISTAPAAIFQINGGSHTVGDIIGTGTTSIIDGDLTATSITQDTLTIGSLVAGTRAPAGNPQFTAVPEPAALILIFTGLLCLIWRRTYN